MNKTKFLPVFILSVMLFSLISGCAGVGRIDSFFSNQEYLQHARLIDFGLFFVMFFALAYLGLSRVWGEGFGKPGAGKGAIVGLSIALALALSFAIVTQTTFSITTIFPVAKAIFFLIIFFVLWGLLVMSKMFGEGGWAKFIAAVLALIATYLLFSIATHFICQMSDNMDDPACKSDFFNAFFTVGGRALGIDDWSLGGGSGGSGGGGGSGSGGGTGDDSSGGSGRGSGSGGGTGDDGSGSSGGGTGGDSTEGGDDFSREGTFDPAEICRLDITFAYDKYEAGDITSAAPIADFVAKVKALGKNSVYVYGFASEEGTTSYNSALSRRRATTIENLISAADPSMSVSLTPRGETTIFDSTLPPNRRVVLSVNRLSGDMFNPSPAPGTLTPACTPQETAPRCGNNKTESNEQCDGSDAKQCPSLCTKDCTCPASAEDKCGNEIVDTGENCDPTVENSCAQGQHCKSDCSACIEGDCVGECESGCSWCWLHIFGVNTCGWNTILKIIVCWILPLLLLLLPLLLLLRRRKREVNIVDAIIIKDQFMQRIEKLWSEKTRAWNEIVIVDHDGMDDRQIKEKAKQLVEHLDNEVKKKWVPLKQLAERYSDNFDKIIEEGLDSDGVPRFDVTEHDLMLIVELFKDLRNKHPAEKKFAKAWDSVVFYSRLEDVAAEKIKTNKAKKELHLFFSLQTKMKEAVKEFKAQEHAIIVKLRQNKKWSSRGKDKIKEGKLEQHTVFSKDEKNPVPSTTYGIVIITQEVLALCDQLLERIAEIIEEEKHATHAARSRERLSVLFNGRKNPAEPSENIIGEKDIVEKLIDAIKRQRKSLSEEWWPVIDDVIVQAGKMEGHIHYRRR